MAEIQISPFSSLNFDNTWSLGFLSPVHYAQPIAPSDTINLQFRMIGVVEIRVTNHCTGAVSLIPFDEIDGYPDIYEAVFNIGTEGNYTLEIVDNFAVPMYFSSFRITSDLEDTVLLHYRNRRNDFDTIFTPDSIFSFRTEGAILPSEKKFLVDAEGFRDQRNKYHQLAAMPYARDTLTLGNHFGVPCWVAEKINQIFALSDIWVDGIATVRSDGSTPEISVFHPDYPLFTYKMEVERDFYAKEYFGVDFNQDFNNDFLIA